MANEKHLEILRSGVEKWNEWRKKNQEDHANLRGANLSGANLSGANLPDADLSNADLSHANLYNAFLSRANISGANLCNAALSRSNLLNANLRGANLYNANLPHTSLIGVNLIGANLSGANLLDTDLLNANLSGANLSGANLSRADLSRANLSGADLSGADLAGANLTSADLFNTDLTDAEIGYTVFGFVDLSTCIGLETVEVRKTCTIDFQTLRTSKNIPKSFLLKIGLPELYINYLPDFYHDEGIRLYPVFLSHSWENKIFARNLYEALIAKSVNVFFDEKKMKPGDNIFDSISRGIDLYDKTILLCSKESLESWWVDQEIELVTEKERNLQKETGEKTGLLIPITIDDHIYNWQGGKRMAIRNRVIGDFRNWQDDTAFEKALNDLINALNVDRPDIKPPTYLKKK